jgi:hypothetical protein
MPGTTYQWEPLKNLIDAGVKDEVKRHWLEIGLDQEAVPLTVDWDAYARKERAGTWRVFTARRDDALIGYIAFHLHKPDRYVGTLFIQEDTIWIIQTERNRGLLWLALWRAALKVLPRPSLVQGKTRNTPEGRRAAKLLKRLAFREIEAVHRCLLM